MSAADTGRGWNTFPLRAGDVVRHTKHGLLAVVVDPSRETTPDRAELRRLDNGAPIFWDVEALRGRWDRVWSCPVEARGASVDLTPDMLRDVLRGLIPGATAEHLDRAVLALRDEEQRIIAAHEALMVPVRDDAPGADATAPNGGSGGAGTDAGPVHQPAPQVGDVWEGVRNGWRGRVSAVRDTYAVLAPARTMDGGKWAGWSMRNEAILAGEWRLVERDGRPWPPTQEPEPIDERLRHHLGALVDWMLVQEPAQEPEPAGDAAVKPATDEQIASLEARDPLDCIFVDVAHALIARLRREQDNARWWGCQVESVRSIERRIAMHATKRIERERDDAVARAEKAEAALVEMRSLDRDLSEILGGPSVPRPAAKRATFPLPWGVIHVDGHVSDGADQEEFWRIVDADGIDICTAYDEGLAHRIALISEMAAERDEARDDRDQAVIALRHVEHNRDVAEAERDEAREALDVAQGEIRLLRAEVERMRPVVEAVRVVHDGSYDNRLFALHQRVLPAYRAYRAAGKEADRGE